MRLKQIKHDNNKRILWKNSVVIKLVRLLVLSANGEKKKCREEEGMKTSPVFVQWVVLTIVYQRIKHI